jgi:hypothetical protein
MCEELDVFHATRSSKLPSATRIEPRGTSKSKSSNWFCTRNSPIFSSPLAARTPDIKKLEKSINPIQALFAYSLQLTAYSLQLTAYSLQLTAYSLQLIHRIYTLKPAISKFYLMLVCLNIKSSM